MKLNVRESIVKMVVKEQINWVVGGYENSILDGLIKEMPVHTELAKEIYSAVMRADVVETQMGMMSVKKDIRFVGTERIQRFIEKKLNQQGY